MSFWDSVTTGAQNAAETTKLVSIVRLFCSLFCSFAVSLSLRLFRGAQSERDVLVKQNSDTRDGVMVSNVISSVYVFLLKSSLH